MVDPVNLIFRESFAYFFVKLFRTRQIMAQITSSEDLGVEDRARYYEKSGALRDMVQNHILQMVALLAMEPRAESSQHLHFFAADFFRVQFNRRFHRQESDHL